MSFRLTDVVRQHTSATDLVALTFDGQNTTYAELDRRAGLAARAMAADGLGAGARVVWLGKNRPEFFDLLFGAPRVRAGTAPLNNRLTHDELIAIIEDSAAPLVVLGPDFADLRERVGVDRRRAPRPRRRRRLRGLARPRPTRCSTRPTTRRTTTASCSSTPRAPPACPRASC